MRTVGNWLAVYSQAVIGCTPTPRRAGWRSAGRRWRSSDRCAPRTWRPRRRSAPPGTRRSAPPGSDRHVYTWEGKQKKRLTKRGARRWLGLSAGSEDPPTQQKGHSRCSSSDTDLSWRSICPATRWTFEVQELFFLIHENDCVQCGYITTAFDYLSVRLEALTAT